MKRIKTNIKFDGPALTGRSMDVADLAPSLIALSDVFKRANHLFNGEKSAIKVLVNADLEQNCFELTLKLAQTIWDQVGVLLSDDNIKTAKEIAEWVGIIGGSSFSLFRLIKFLKGRKVTDVIILKQEGGHYNIQIKVEGENNSIIVPQPVYSLYTEKGIREKAVAVLQPLKSDGYESLTFYEGKEIFEKFTPEDVPDLQNDELPDLRPHNEQISIIQTSVRIRKAAYEGKSKWTIVYLRAIEASIDDEEWLEKFQSNGVDAPPNSSLLVDLEQRVILNDRGEALEDPIYRVKKVHKVIHPQQQMRLI